jgi:hypothetical protein
VNEIARKRAMPKKIVWIRGYVSTPAFWKQLLGHYGMCFKLWRFMWWSSTISRIFTQQ